MKNLKFAVIGTGGQGRGWCKHLNRYSKLAGVNLMLTAICDINEQVANKIGAQYNVKAYSNYHEMFEKEVIDCVIIATPHFLHAPMAIAAADKGINVLVEKIMCTNLEQADAMIEAVERNKIKLAVGFQHRFDKSTKIMKNLIQSGEMGNIFQINMIYHWWRTEDYYLNSTPVQENEEEDWEGWRGHWKTEGGGALANQIIHFLDVFQYLAPSKPKSIMAACRVAKHTFVETDDNTNAIIEFEDGSMGFIQAGVAYEHDKQEEYHIYGTKGTLLNRKRHRGIFGIPKATQLFVKKSEKKGKMILKKYQPKLKQWYAPKSLLNNFVESILKDDLSIISVDVYEGRKTVEIIRAIIISQKTGKKVMFPVKDDKEYPELEHNYVDEKFKDLV